jgi:hypothetical protein
MRTRPFLKLLLILTLFVWAANADTVVSTTGTWQAGGWTPDNNGTPYWDNKSSGSENNIGFCLIASCGIGAPGALPYLANPDEKRTAPSSFYFETNNSADRAVMKIEISGLSHVNAFGYYDIYSDHIVRHELFAGSANAPQTAFFSSETGKYGLYFQTQIGENKYWYYTEASRGDDNTSQHFAVFQESAVLGSEKYWLGMEDLYIDDPGNTKNGGYGASDRDYQDMIVTLEAVPEPASIFLLGTSMLLGVGFIRRRRSM